MAIDVPLPPQEIEVPVARRRRTWRGQIECPVDVPSSEWWVMGHRHDVQLTATGKVYKEEPLPNVRRTLEQIRDQVFSVPGCPSVTGMQLMQIVSAAMDKFDQEDAAAAEAAAQLPLPTPPE
jgi:hypothetical protein